MDRARTHPGQPLGLASWLGTGSILIVLLAVTAMVLACALLLTRMSNQQAQIRAQLAVTQGREQLRRLGEDTLTDARVLAERPTLQRLLEENDRAGLAAFLQRYCESSHNTACAVVDPAGTVLDPAAALPWPQLLTAAREQGERFAIAPKDGSAPLWAAIATMSAPAGHRVMVVRRVTAPLLRELGAETGAQLQLVNFATYQAPQEDPLTGLHSQALATSGAQALRLPDDSGYAASMVIAAASGEVIALLDARLPAGAFQQTLQRLRSLLIVIALLVAAVAGVAGLLYGRYLAAPLVALRDSAERIGHGDLIASVPPMPTRELGALAQSMDGMRQNLLALTENLRQREAEAQALLGGIVEGVYAVDEQRRIRYVNPQMARLLGRSAEELRGRFCGDVLNPAGGPDGQRPCAQHCPILLARRQPQASARELLCVSADNRRSAIIVSAPPVAGLQVQVLRDETELEAARRARDGVLGNISHEFRTPLAAQLASIELLRDGLQQLPPEAQHELLANVERGVLRLMRLIDNLLESVRIEAGQLAIREQQLDVAEVAGEAAELLRPLLLQRRLQLLLELEQVHAPARGDGQRLQQVFINLVSNAIKYAPEGTPIRIGGRTLPTQLEIWVEDEGPGVDERNSALIFERFQRAGGAEPDAPGLGLGLWIVRSIIERHHGTIQVARTATAHTRFTFTLPRDLPE